MDDNQDEEQKAYEERLRRRLKILRKTFEEGNISIPNDPHIEESLLAVRYGPNGEIDLEKNQQIKGSATDPLIVQLVSVVGYLKDLYLEYYPK